MRVKCKWENQSLCPRSYATCKTINRIPGLIQKSCQSHICWSFCDQDRLFCVQPGLHRACADRDRQCYFPGHMPSLALRAGNSVCISFLQVPWAISGWHNISLQNCFLQSLSEVPLLTKFCALKVNWGRLPWNGNEEGISAWTFSKEVIAVAPRYFNGCLSSSGRPNSSQKIGKQKHFTHNKQLLVSPVWEKF